MRPTFFHHLHPPGIPAEQARFRYTLGAGGVAIFTFFVAIVTGALQLFHYIPDAQEAALSIQEITYLVPFGWLVRGLHFWSAQLLVIAATLHLLRVVFTGAYGAPRRFNYLIGMGLLFLFVLLDFSGYVLRWDQAVVGVLGTGVNLVKSIPGIGGWLSQILVGGPEIGPAAIIRIFSWHVYGLGLLAVLLTVWHIFRVRRDGGIAASTHGGTHGIARITRDELVQRETVAAIFVLAGLVLLSLLFRAPIAPVLSNTGIPPPTGYSPWFFRWVQQLLKLGNPFVFGVLIPLALFSLLALIPFFLQPPPKEELENWFPQGGSAARWTFASVLAIVLLLTIFNWLSSP